MMRNGDLKGFHLGLSGEKGEIEMCSIAREVRDG
jgi:hypothetical protein